MTEPIKKEYSNGELTVVWEPHKCIHSKKCVTGLPAVFDFNRRPWIKADSADSETIAKQIDTCPSGALSYYYLDKEKEKSQETSEVQKVEVTQNGPLLVHGKLHIQTSEGEHISDKKITAFCRCGGSQNKPFCDGTHKKIDFKG
ncbi:putative Fe-S cluster protein YjdI [Algoriphagus iocasae]|jgi:uncharacterized Fe-S cluster protein YjdI|uniref:Putative Fe-S cluster protein YjdI n=1 Tax=Algoriphagus iocasae TaxID=1836499 RepID=A0A841N224_9BACT|nr:(4Fe-4S)-binding protein [Algoriphagus iocasae]MBB6328221.1 putative Fe-S cluster protein YjdI [Algoriphagus iocasae]